MKTETIFGKMREYIKDFKEQRAKGDSSSVPALTENSRNFFRELMGELPACGTVKREVETFASCVEVFGTACRQSDLQTASRTLAEMESALAAVQKQCGVK